MDGICSALTDLTPDALRADQREAPHVNPLWRTVVADRLKNRHLLWRTLTVELLRSARGGRRCRYNLESVTGLLRQKLGRWLRPVKNGVRWKTLDRDVNELAEEAIRLDWYVVFPASAGSVRG
jgi:hypothetical protein